MTIGITHKAIGHLMEAVSSSTATIRLTFGDAQAFLSAPGDYVYALLRGTVDREIVKIDIAASILLGPGYLSVARGQGGTIATAWVIGSLIVATTNEDHFNALLQSGVARTIAYNPNEVLTPLHAGEKVYQSGPGGCERWWKAYNGVDAYWDIITGAPCGTEIYEDTGWLYDLLVAGVLVCFEDRTSDTFWAAVSGFGTWNGTKWSHPSMVGLEPVGGWEVGYRPTRLRVTRPDGDINTTVNMTADPSGTIVNETKVCGAAGTIFDLDFSLDRNIKQVIFTGSAGPFGVSISGIEFFTCDIESYYPETSDGRVQLSGGPPFSNVRNATDGDTVTAAGAYEILRCEFQGPGTFLISRIFLWFDLSAAALTNLFSATLKMSAYSITGSLGEYQVGLQEATPTQPLVTADFDAFTGLQFVDAPVNMYPAGNYEFQMNQAGIDYCKSKLGGIACFCLREDTYDISNVQPGASNWGQIHMVEESNIDDRPLLELTGE